MIQLLLDQGLPLSSASLLASLGYDALHVEEADYSRADDRRIIELALAQGRVIVTLDSDFHQLLALSGARKPSVIRIRREGLRAQELAELIANVVQRFGSQLSAGAMISVTAKTIRVHRLPAGKVFSREGNTR